MSREFAGWHLIAGEYPPVAGGVAAFTREIAAGLADAGVPVHVWCPGQPCAEDASSEIRVHRLPHGWTRIGIAEADAQLDAVAGRRRLALQWVPHGFGARSLNVAFCRWIRRRARRGDVLDVVVHEPFLPFGGTWRQHAAAAVHRHMLRTVLAGASRVFVSTAAWTAIVQTYLPPGVEAVCLPVPSSIPRVARPSEVADLRRRYVREGEILVGHFGTYGRDTRALLDAIVPALVNRREDVSLVLFGRDSDAYLAARRADGWSGRVHATGAVGDREASLLLQASDLMIQPYSDGLTTRRTTLMAALAHGRPVVSTIGFLSEPFWAGTRAVAVVRTGEVYAFVAETDRLAGDAEARARLGQAAAALYDLRFSREQAVRVLTARPAGTD